jgi:hypothetical protein
MKLIKNRNLIKDFSCFSSSSCFPVGILPLEPRFDKLRKKSLAPYRESEMILVPCETGEAV